MGKRYKALLQERADLVKEQGDIFAVIDHEGREMSEAEKARDDAIHARLTELAADVEREERRREWERTVEAKPLSGVPVSSLEAITGERDDIRPFRTLGEQMAAVIKSKMHPHDADPRLEKFNRLMAATGMYEGGLAEGGAFVQTEFSNTLMERTYQQGMMLSRVPEQPIGPNANAYSVLLIKETSRAAGSRYGGLRVYRVGEGGTITSSRPEFDRKEIRPYKLAALCYLTDELVQDAAALEGHVRRLFPLEAAFVMENELINGTGAGQSMGLLNAAATVSISKETGQAAATIVYQNLLKMWARHWNGANSVWCANKDTFPQLMSLFLAAGTAGIPAQGIQFVNGDFVIFGRPVLFCEQCPTLGTVGDICLVDWGQYLAVTKGQLRTDASLHVAFTTDEMALRFIWRYTAEPLWRSALTPASGSGNTLSPYVTLATRA
mgnify:CR=1 FL=1